MGYWPRIKRLLPIIRSSSAYQTLVSQLQAGQTLPGLALPRSARLPVLAGLYQDLGWPILLITDRTDHALLLADELGFWAPEAPHVLFPAPNPLFYEQAAWGVLTRRERLLALTSLAMYHLPGMRKPSLPPILVTPVRALMVRTLPRRDFLKVTRAIRPGQQVKPEALLRQWADIGYQPEDIVVLDVWPPAEPYPARLEFFGDEIDTLRRFDPATQRTLQNLETLLITPAREVLPGRAAEAGFSPQEISEFNLPLVHLATASLLDRGKSGQAARRQHHRWPAAGQLPAPLSDLVRDSGQPGRPSQPGVGAIHRFRAFAAGRGLYARLSFWRANETFR